MGSVCTSGTNSDSARISTVEAPQCSEDIFECYQLIRLRQVLWHYQQWSLSLQSSDEEKRPTVSIYQYVNELKASDIIIEDDQSSAASATDTENTETYSNVLLLQDYHHLMHKHSANFEEIYSYFSDESSSEHTLCTLSSCALMQRNHRQRSRDDDDPSAMQRSRSREQLYYASDDVNEVITQQILDQIHCYIYHSFDIGFKLTHEEREEIELEIESKHNDDDNKVLNLMDDNDEDDDDEEVVQLLNERRKRERVGRILQRKKERVRNELNEATVPLLDDNKKFVSVVDDDDENKTNNEETNEQIAYSFGVRFYYKKEYENDSSLDVHFNVGSKYSDWFVDKKYMDLRDELLHNATSVITKEQWDDLCEKSKYYQQTEYVKEHCGGITDAHLIAVQIYCNFDDLQSKLTATYRKKAGESDESLKKRHTEFRTLGKRLRDSVEYLGTRVQKGATKVFYHGISSPMNFTSTLHKFYAPTSTSGEYTVALAFTNNNGIVLELNDGTWLWDSQNSLYFDCEFISDFGYEKEKLFLGGMVPLKIVSIFDVQSNRNYAVYVQLINILLSICAGDISIQLSQKNEIAIVRLIKHETNEKELDIPDYIKALFHSVCLNVDSFTTRWEKTFGAKPTITNRKSNKIRHHYHKLAQYLCSANCDFFNLNVLCTLFPNLESIAINRSVLTRDVLDDILKYLKEAYNIKAVINVAPAHAQCRSRSSNDDDPQIMRGDDSKQSDTSDDDDDALKLKSIVFKSCISGRGSLSFKKLHREYAYKFKKLKWVMIIENKSLVIREKRRTHSRAASAHLIKSQKTLGVMEAFVLQQSFDQHFD